MFKDIIIYPSNEEYTQILNNKYQYVFFDISECTEKNLENKCDFILAKQSLAWKPLTLQYKHNVHTYIKRFYFKKL